VTARRALKTLETLGRARDFELSERRREAAVAVDRLQRTIAMIGQLRDALREEGEVLTGEPAMMRVYAAFAADARRRITALVAMQKQLEADVDRADERVREAFEALKQVEQAADARRQEIALEDARKEQAADDDMATSRAMRPSA